MVPDGTRFVAVAATQKTAAGAGAAIQVVLNWTEELKRLVPMQ